MAALALLDYAHDDVALRGELASPEGDGPHPDVLVLHSAVGLRDHERRSAARLAGLGYVALVADMYGADHRDVDPRAAGAQMAALQADTVRFRGRVQAGLAALAALPGVDAGRTAAIGYCFGGQCALELARSGADVRAVVSYHGLLTTAAPAEAGAIRGEVVIFTGAHDPWAPAEHVEAVRSELIAAGARWQLTVFGEGRHGFTDPDAASLGREGVEYHPTLDAVSWAATTALLSTALG